MIRATLSVLWNSLDATNCLSKDVNTKLHVGNANTLSLPDKVGMQIFVFTM